MIGPLDIVLTMTAALGVCLKTALNLVGFVISASGGRYRSHIL